MLNKARPIVCIIGSGPGGSIAAMELAKSGMFDVIIVDIDFISNKYKQNKFEELQATYSGHPFNQEHTRGFGFGGGSNLWHGVLTRLDNDDLATLDEQAGYPVSVEILEYYQQLDDYFEGLSKAFNSPTNSFVKIGKLYKEFFGAEKFVRKDFFLQKTPLRTRKLIEVAVEKYGNIRTIDNSVALFLRSGSSKKSCATELVVHRNGNLETIGADYFIVSAGALETPRIFLQSIERGFDAVKNRNIGCYLVDHPWLVIGELGSKNGYFRLGFSDVFSKGGFRYRVGLLPRMEVGGVKSEYSNHCLSLKPIFFGGYEDFKEILKSLISNQKNVINIVKILLKNKPLDLLACLLLLVAEKSGIGVWVKRALVFCYLEQKPNIDSRVTLSASYDIYGRRIPDVAWLVSDVDVNQANRINEFLGNFIKDSNHFIYKPYAVEVQCFASGSHHAGTMKIGANAAKGVIDRNLKVFGSDNVFICDLSIFPNYGNSNPTLTLCAFSKRLSHHLIRLARRTDKK